MVQGSIPVHTWITVVSAIRISLSLSVSSLRPFYFFSPRSIGLPVSLTPNTNARLNPAPRFFRERTQSRAMRTCARMKTASNCTDTRERGKDRGGEFLFERCFERASREFINAEVGTMIYDTEGSVSKITLSFLGKQILCSASRRKSRRERERDGFIDYRREDENRNKFVREVGEFELKIQEVGLRINEYVSMFARGIPFHARLNLGTNIEAMARVVLTTPIACSNVRLILFRSKRTDRIECRRFINIRRSSSYTRIRF